LQSQVMADEQLLSRVLFNLIYNAVAIAPKDSTIRSSVHADGDKVVFNVTDEGPGIADDFIEKIFERFFQIEGEEQFKSNSYGLGLAFCKSAIEAQSGKIWAESNSPTGASFYIILPGVTV